MSHSVATDLEVGNIVMFKSFKARRGTLAGLRLLSALAVATLAAGCGPQASGDAVVGVSAEALTASDVTRVTVMVSGPGITPDIVRELVKTGGQWGGIIGGIPAGGGRTFVGKAYDASGTLVYEGQATGVTISRNATASVLIILQQKTPPNPFSNSAPRITSLVTSAGELDPGQAAALAVTAVDPDGDALSYAWAATGGSLANANTANPTWTAPASEEAYTLSVSVTDGRGGQAGLSLVLNVGKGKGGAAVNTSFNTWPVVSQVSAAPGQVAPGQGSSLQVTAVDPDGDALAYAWADDCGGSFSSTSAQNPTWTAPATAPPGGTCMVTVTPSDGRGGSTTGSFTIQVGLPAPSSPPVLDASFQSVDTVDAGGMVTFMVQAHDPEGTAVTFTWSATGGTLGAPVTGATQSDVSWMAPAFGGSFTLTAVVRDGGGAQATQSFSVTVVGPPGGSISPIAEGDWSTLLLKSDGTLWATGDNAYGEFGDGTTTSRSSFVQVLSGVSSVAAGGVHTLALKSDGTLWATGRNDHGGLGDGTTTERHGFVQVLSGVSRVAASHVNTLALKSDGTLWATGWNDFGQLGDGTTTERHGFVQVLSGVSSVAAGGFHTLALKSDGTLWATGHNPVGEFGDGTIGDRSNFVQVLSGVSSVTGGWHQTLALKSDGTLWATGYNGYGQLGDGTTTDRSSFVQVLSGVSSVGGGTGYYHIALKSDGTLWGTGANSFGQLGDGTTTDRHGFVQVTVP